MPAYWQARAARETWLAGIQGQLWPRSQVLEITLSSAAVARGFTSYLSALLGWRADALRLSAGPLEIDPPAALLVLGLTALLVAGTKQSSAFNIGATAQACFLQFRQLHAGCEVRVCHSRSRRPSGPTRRLPTACTPSHPPSPPPTQP